MNSPDDLWLQLMQLNPDLEDRLWAGEVPADDPPEWSRELTTLITATRGPATAEELRAETTTVRAMRAAVLDPSPQPGASSDTPPPAQVRRRAFRPAVRVGAGVGAMIFGVATAAAASGVGPSLIPGWPRKSQPVVETPASVADAEGGGSTGGEPPGEAEQGTGYQEQCTDASNDCATNGEDGEPASRERAQRQGQGQGGNNAETTTTSAGAEADEPAEPTGPAGPAEPADNQPPSASGGPPSGPAEPGTTTPVPTSSPNGDEAPASDGKGASPPTRDAPNTGGPGRDRPTAANGGDKTPGHPTTTTPDRSARPTDAPTSRAAPEPRQPTTLPSQPPDAVIQGLLSISPVQVHSGGNL